MSTLITRSVFYYGHLVSSQNQMFDFLEGATPRVAIMSIGDKTLSEFAEELAQIMTLSGTQDYTAVVDRTTGVITLSAAGVFTPQPTGGPNEGTSGWPLAGFTVNPASLVSQVGDARSGLQYVCQYKLFNYIALEDYEVLEQASVNQSAQGQVQVISFGDGRRMECDIRMITNENLANQTGFNYNPAGENNARAFMKYITNKHKIEFMPNEAVRSTYSEVQLDSTPQDRMGTAYSLRNMAYGVYMTGRLVFREVIR